ncbi:NAD(P)/FAD-dependent oxidoreductase [Nocardia cyriacigeorgica]|uniref:NAD(P)/FAD-dependent oxidoreductase n=1 Tax=Nocardia cyriacigeorgica TaxID=135487 RepID=UPI00189417AF|nr:FAD-dependent oxidoreductase [Nocardia cyriacigeorgica]MBF6414927.1 FAD-dependent oxidoreductase [Nocardia cyriacigeorgica]
MTENNNTNKVVVVGGGYAGAVAANRLQARSDIEVTLVNPRPQFVERIRLHQLVAGTSAAAVDFAAMLGERVRLVVDSAIRIDTTSKTVELASGSALDYDYVVYAVGSTAATPGSVPGASEFAYPIGEFEHAQRLRTAVEALAAGARITVIGGGPTGIETAAELAEQGHAVTLIGGGQLAPSVLKPARRSITKWLTKHGVEVLETARVTEVWPDRVVLDDGTVLPSPVAVWTAGFGVPELAARSGLRTDSIGRLLTDESLISIDDDRVIAAGDAAAPSGQPLRMSCQAAGPLGAHAADTVLARIDGLRPAALNVGFVGTGISLGRRASTVQFSRRDDTARNFHLGGRIGAWVKEEVCKGTVTGIQKEARKPGSFPTIKGSGNRPEQPVREPDMVPNS